MVILQFFLENKACLGSIAELSISKLKSVQLLVLTNIELVHQVFILKIIDLVQKIYICNYKQHDRGFANFFSDNKS